MKKLFILYLLSNAVTLRRDLSILFNIIIIKNIKYYIKIIINCVKVIIYYIIEYIENSIIYKGLGIHGGLLHISNIIQIFYIFIYLISKLILQLTSFYLITTNDFISIIFFCITLLYHNLPKHFIVLFYNIFNFNNKNEGSYYNKLDSILNFFVIYINIYTKNINCLIIFSFSFLFLLLYNVEVEVLNIWNIPGEVTFYLIYLYLSFLLFSIGFMINLVRFLVKIIWFNSLNPNYFLSFSFNILKFLLFGLLLLNIIIIIMLGQKILILFKWNIMNKLKDWKFNLEYEIKKGNKGPKNPQNFNIFSSLKKKNEKRKEAINLKEKIYEVQKKNNTVSNVDFSIKPDKISLSKNRNWTKKIEIPKGSDFTIESQIQNIEYEYQAYLNQEKKFKKIVIDINNNKENFYPSESKFLFKEYVKVIKLLKSNLKDIKKELNKVSN